MSNVVPLLSECHDMVSQNTVHECKYSRGSRKVEHEYDSVRVLRIFFIQCQITAKSETPVFHCEFSTETSVHLRYHVKANHYDSKCEICGKKFLNDMGLKTHQERTHGSGGNLNCKICNKTINGQLQTLRNHELVCDGRSSEAKSVFAINSECRLDKVQTKGLCNTDRKTFPGKVVIGFMKFVVLKLFIAKPCLERTV